MTYKANYLSLFLTSLPLVSQAQGSLYDTNYLVIPAVVLLVILFISLFLLKMVLFLRASVSSSVTPLNLVKKIVTRVNASTLNKLIAHRVASASVQKKAAMILILLLPAQLFAQSPSEESLIGQGGIVITLVLISIPLLFAVLFSLIRVKNLVNRVKQKENEQKSTELADYIISAGDKKVDDELLAQKTSIEFKAESLLKDLTITNEDKRGLLESIDHSSTFSMVAAKAKVRTEQEDLPHGKLIIWFLGSAVFWLLFGTSVGEYLGIKFVAPEADSVSWLSFGRLRPVHTNAVFWGWSSLAMLGLAYYVVPKVSNVAIASLKKGWATLWLINAAVIIGSLCLMGGINNGGGEYREYIWPVMGLFGLGLVLTLINLLQTIARRKHAEIYISNWYIVSAIIFTLVIAFIAYWPTWQNGLGETIVQGYYMHQGVGMWFMLFNLGLVYYFLPQQVNKPIYSYGLGILAFWSQIIFYTLIGTHHFVFSSIPWWLQTVAIVGSVGMIIPVVAGTTNFYMTFKGAWHKMSGSYTLPFFFVGILFYFTGSLQGTAEAFRFTNLLWHFTDFTVAHSHLTMYGIIAFLLWGCIYVLVPRITGKEPSQILTGIHFWMAFIGLMFYTIPLMIGGTMKGMMWMEGRFFIESVTAMAPFWLWRAIGGTLMWISHIIFAINFYRMVSRPALDSVEELTIQKLNERLASVNI